jgi:hypothetical protein
VLARIGMGAGAIAAALALASCGDSQTADTDTSGGYKVSANADFPDNQKLARTSQLRIEVTNEDTRTIPDVAATVLGFDYELKDPNNPDLPDPDVADPERPQFVVDRSPIEYMKPPEEADPSLVDKEVAVPYGRQTAYVGTSTLGALAPGKVAIFRWDVTAVKAGPYKLTWNVEGGVEPGQSAEGSDGQPITGNFEGDVSDAPVDAEVAKDGKSVVTGDRKVRY